VLFRFCFVVEDRVADIDVHGLPLSRGVRSEAC
jgi:hypothetical protein